MSALNEADFRNDLSPDASAPTGYLTVPWAEKTLGAGSAPVCFSRSWLAAQSLKIDFLQAVLPDEINIDGVPSQDVLAVVDTRAGLRKGHGLWCFRVPGKIRVAHLTFAGDVTVIHPSRPELEPEIIEGPISQALTIYGKVVWLGQTIPFKGRVG